MIQDYTFGLRESTPPELLYDKIKEYVTLAESVITDDMDADARYHALEGLYNHIDNENGGYIDQLRNAPYIDGVSKKDTGDGGHGSGNGLNRFVEYAKSEFHKPQLKSVIGGVEHYTLGMNWGTQGRFEAAQELLFMLLTVIGNDGEFYWKQVKIRTGKELLKFWEEREKNITDAVGKIRNTDAKADNGIAILSGDIWNRYFDIAPTSGIFNRINAKKQQRNKSIQTKAQPLLDKVNREILAIRKDAKQNGKQEKKEINETEDNNMIAKGRPTPDTVETGDEQFLSIKLIHYAEDIRKMLNMADEEQGTKKVMVKYNCLNSELGKIMAESGKYVQIIKNLTPEELDIFDDAYSAECDCRLQCDGEDLSKLDVFIDMILEESKRGWENEGYESWIWEKADRHYWSTFLLHILVCELKHELEESYSLLVSANCPPEKPIATMTRTADTAKQKINGEEFEGERGTLAPPNLKSECTLISKYDEKKLLKVYKNLTDKEYLFCTEDAWLYVWGVRVHPTKKTEIKAPTELPRWSAMRGKKSAISDMIRTLITSDCGNMWKKTARLFVYSDGSQPVDDNLKSAGLAGPSKSSFLELLTVH